MVRGAQTCPSGPSTLRAEAVARVRYGRGEAARRLDVGFEKARMSTPVVLRIATVRSQHAGEYYMECK